MNRLASLARSSAAPLTITFALIAIALAVAVLSNAPLLYDGSFFLYHAINSQAIQIPQLRITFGWLQWPVVLASHVTSSFPILRALYAIPIVAAPLVGMALSWWVVRKDRPHLIIWPALGILLVDLPGQMHWIATSIRTNQLFWPILLAVFLGMPDRVVPAVVMLTIVILLLHPQVTIFLLAATLAALVTARLHPEHRRRLHAAAACFAFAAIYRAGAIEVGYESGEMSLDNQQRQWQEAVFGLPAYALVAVAVAALAIFAVPRLPARMRPLAWLAPLALALSGVIFLTWAGDPGEWKSAIDYRGPSLILSLLLMGLAFLDATLRLPATADLARITRARISLTPLAAVIFCLTIVVQSGTWRGELDTLRAAMAASETPCVPDSTIPGIDSNPASFWSIPAMSLMLQDTTPDRVILPDRLCETAAETGTFPLALYEPDVLAPSGTIDLLPLGWSMAGDGACWMRLTTGWHEHEQDGETWWRWSPGEGEIRVIVGQDATAVLGGKINSLPRPNQVDVVVNGKTQHTFELANDEWIPMNGTPLQLRAGENTVRFVSAEPAGTAPPDQRDLAFALMNLDLTVPTLRSQCSQH